VPNLPVAQPGNFSTQVLQPLKMPRPLNWTTRYSQNGLPVSACFSPSSISARTFTPAGQGGKDRYTAVFSRLPPGAERHTVNCSISSRTGSCGSLDGSQKRVRKGA